MSRASGQARLGVHRFTAGLDGGSMRAIWSSLARASWLASQGRGAPSPRPLPLEHGQDLEVAEPVPQHGQGPELVAAEGHGSSWQMGS
jgi:hypothetical protein